MNRLFAGMQVDMVSNYTMTGDISFTDAVKPSILFRLFMDL